MVCPYDAASETVNLPRIQETDETCRISGTLSADADAGYFLTCAFFPAKLTESNEKQVILLIIVIHLKIFISYLVRNQPVFLKKY